MLSILALLEKKNVQLISLRENFDTHTSLGKIMTVFVRTMAEYERDLINERRRDGIENAITLGKYKGRIPVKKPENFYECYNKYITSGPFNRYTLKQFANETNLKMTTLRNFILKEKEINTKNDKNNENL